MGTGGTFQFSEEAIESPLDGNGYVPVSVGISGLIANTDYQFRIKAENALGITFSDEMNFRTFYSTVSDIDGNDYPTVIIGEQEWMAQNLKTTKYSDGTVILKGPENNSEWSELQVAAYTIYPHSIVDGINSDVQMVNAYGLLYNGYSVNDKTNICPVGWRVPSMDDWIKLAEFVEPGFSASNSDWWRAGSNSSNALRSTRTEPDAHPRWQSNSGANNSTLFSALPGGSRRENGNYEALGSSFSAFWANSSIHGNFDCINVVDLTDYDFTRGECYPINAAWPVRCIKD